MRAGHLEAAARVAAAAFSRDFGDEGVARRWRERIAYPWQTDPGGAFVAEIDAQVIGVAEAIVRERLWCLSMLAVEPGIQSAAAGRALMERAAEYGGAADPGLIVSSNDPRALRLYAAWGFALHPTFEAGGVVDRRRMPALGGSVREDGGEDLEAFAGLTREVRGAPYTDELHFLLAQGARLLRIADHGFAAVNREGMLWALVARDEETAGALLWNALAWLRGRPGCDGSPGRSSGRSTSSPVPGCGSRPTVPYAFAVRPGRLPRSCRTTPSPRTANRYPARKQRGSTLSVISDSLGDLRAGGQQQPHDLGVGLLGDLVEDLHGGAALGVVAVARSVQRGPHRAASVTEGQSGTVLEKLAGHPYAPAPGRVPERDVLAVRTTAQQPRETGVQDRRPAVGSGRLVDGGLGVGEPVTHLRERARGVLLGATCRPPG
jgi:GNAT superfamily N-acetyltransferase